MKKKPTTNRRTKKTKSVVKQSPSAERMPEMSYAELRAAASSDADNPPLTEKQLRSLRRVPSVKRLRWRVGLSQSEFAKQFEIPVGTLRDWEQGRSQPDQAARAYLKVIAADPGRVGAR